MKKIIAMVYLTATVLCTTMTFLSCSKDNNDNDVSSTDVNPKAVFVGGLPKSAAGMTIQTNEKGQVVSITSSGGKRVTFKYKDATRSTTATPDVVMTLEEGREKLVCNLYLNKDGFVKHCEETEYNSDEKQEETWDFTYNADGQLLTMLRSEGGNETTTIKYQNGNIIETETVSADEPKEKSSYKVYYTAADSPSTIENKGCIMLFDLTLGIDIDEMQYAYYAGLLGKATRNLPVRLVEENNHTKLFSWTLNSAGYPISLKSPYETYSFVW